MKKIILGFLLSQVGLAAGEFELRWAYNLSDQNFLDECEVVAKQKFCEISIGVSTLENGSNGLSFNVHSGAQVPKPTIGSSEKISTAFWTLFLPKKGPNGLPTEDIQVSSPPTGDGIQQNYFIHKDLWPSRLNSLQVVPQFALSRKEDILALATSTTVDIFYLERGYTESLTVNLRQGLVRIFFVNDLSHLFLVVVSQKRIEAWQYQRQVPKSARALEHIFM